MGLLGISESTQFCFKKLNFSGQAIGRQRALFVFPAMEKVVSTIHQNSSYTTLSFRNEYYNTQISDVLQE